MDCPEFDIEGGKTLYEVLRMIGRLFKGTPVLLANNVISFKLDQFLVHDVTSEDGQSDPTIKLFEDSTELMQIRIPRRGIC